MRVYEIDLNLTAAVNSRVLHTYKLKRTVFFSFLKLRDVFFSDSSFWSGKGEEKRNALLGVCRTEKRTPACLPHLDIGSFSQLPRGSSEPPAVRDG